jgi:DNA-binding IclR family transcriptional regulator
MTRRRASPLASDDEMTDGTPAASGSQAIHRAFRLLRLVAGSAVEGGRLAELAAAAALKPATTHRILQALVQEGLVAQQPGTRRYRLQREYFRLADAAEELDLRGLMRPVLSRASARFADSFYLSVRSGLEVVCIDRVTGDTPIRVVPYDIGARRPLGVGAAGIVLLAAEEPGRAAEIMRRNAAHYADYQLDVAAIATLVNACRREGHSYNPGKFIRGVSGLGVPVLDKGGRTIGAINATAISPRLVRKARRQEIVGFLVSELARLGQCGSSPPAS